MSALNELGMIVLWALGIVIGLYVLGLVSRILYAIFLTGWKAFED